MELQLAQFIVVAVALCELLLMRWHHENPSQLQTDRQATIQEEPLSEITVSYSAGRNKFLLIMFHISMVILFGNDTSLP